MNTDKIIFYATKNSVNRMVNLMRDKFMKNTGMSEDSFKKLKFYFRKDLERLVTDLVYNDIQELHTIYQSYRTNKPRAIKPGDKQLSSNVESELALVESSELTIQEAVNRFKFKLDVKIRDVLMFPYFIVKLASRDQQGASFSMSEEIRNTKAEIKELINYKKIIVTKRTPREEFVKAILLAINELEKKSAEGKRKKITITAIVKQMGYNKRASFYDDRSKHHIDVDKNLNIIDRITKEPFVFNQQ